MQTEALFSCHDLGSMHPLQDQARLSPQLVQHGRLEECDTEGERVAEPFRQCQCVGAACQRLIRVADQPAGKASNNSCADPGIVSAVERCVRAVPFEVIEPTSLLALRAPRKKLAAKKLVVQAA